MSKEETPSKPSYRFKVTVGNDPLTMTPPKVLFVYGYDKAEARAKLPVALPIASFEPAGYVEDGVTHYPTEELRAVMKTMQDGRKAPGA